MEILPWLRNNFFAYIREKSINRSINSLADGRQTHRVRLENLLSLGRLVQPLAEQVHRIFLLNRFFAKNFLRLFVLDAKR